MLRPPLHSYVGLCFRGRDGHASPQSAVVTKHYSDDATRFRVRTIEDDSSSPPVEYDSRGFVLLGITCFPIHPPLGIRVKLYLQDSQHPYPAKVIEHLDHTHFRIALEDGTEFHSESLRRLGFQICFLPCGRNAGNVHASNPYPSSIHRALEHDLTSSFPTAGSGKASNTQKSIQDATRFQKRARKEEPELTSGKRLKLNPESEAFEQEAVPDAPEDISSTEEENNTGSFLDDIYHDDVILVNKAVSYRKRNGKGVRINLRIKEPPKSKKVAVHDEAEIPVAPDPREGYHEWRGVYEWHGSR